MLNKSLTGKILKIVVLLQVFGLAFCGCGHNDFIPEPIPEVISPPISTEKIVSGSPTPFTIPTLPTLTPTVQALSATNAMTTVPTLTYEKSKELILELIHTNDNMQLPCFWGICPGVTDWESTQQFLRYIHARFSVDERGDKNYIFSGFDIIPMQLPLSLTLIAEEGIIENIAVGMGELESLGWEIFTMPVILNTYGPPTKVLISINFPVEPPTENVVAYELFIFYDKPSIFISYPVSKIKLEPIFHICPYSNTSNMEDGVYMILGNLNSIFSSDTIGPLTYLAQDLEDVSNMSLEDFYKAFKDRTSNECIRSDRTLWSMVEGK